MREGSRGPRRRAGSGEALRSLAAWAKRVSTSSGNCQLNKVMGESPPRVQRSQLGLGTRLLVPLPTLPWLGSHRTPSWRRTLRAHPTPALWNGLSGCLAAGLVVGETQKTLLSTRQKPREQGSATWLLLRGRSCPLWAYLGRQAERKSTGSHAPAEAWPGVLPARTWPVRRRGAFALHCQSLD